MPGTAITITTRQAAVGQGGLMSSEIVFDPQRFERRLSFAFDCGSFNRERLYECIDSIDGEELDIVFLSHLDADHVNCIDRLLAKKQVETVVLPCLDALQTLVIVSRSLDGAGTSGDFATFVENPVKWFARRGVKRVILVGRDDDDGNAPLPPSPQLEPLLGAPEHVVEAPNRTPPRIAYKLRSGGRPHSIRRVKIGAAEVELIVTDPAVQIDTILFSQKPLRHSVRWTLLPYVHPFEAESLTAFRHMVRRTLRVPTAGTPADAAFTRRLLQALKDPKSRADLRRCYHQLARDHNEVSMSLYSGPLPGQSAGWRSDVTTRYFDEPWHHASRTRTLTPAKDQPGWLCTGDANLKLVRTRTAWFARYDAVLPHVGVFVLPHHGSAHSLSSEVLDRIGNATYLACAAQNRQHHPHQDVIDRVRQRGYGLWQVSEASPSTFGTAAAADYA